MGRDSPGPSICALVVQYRLRKSGKEMLASSWRVRSVILPVRYLPILTSSGFLAGRKLGRIAPPGKILRPRAEATGRGAECSQALAQGLKCFWLQLFSSNLLFLVEGEPLEGSET
jgi:hypothetical protein